MRWSDGRVCRREGGAPWRWFCSELGRATPGVSRRWRRPPAGSARDSSTWSTRLILGGMFEDIFELAQPTLVEQLPVEVVRPKFDRDAVFMGAV